MLAAAGGAAGVAVAALGIKLFGRALPAKLPLLPPTHLSMRVLGFTGLLTIVTALLVGLIPALRVVRGNSVGEAMTAGSARVGDTRRRTRFRSVLVTTEIALSLVLVVAATLMLRSVAALQDVDPGFSPHHVLTMRIAPNADTYADPARWTAFYRELVTKTGALPGVQSVGLLNAVPLFSGSYDGDALPEGRADRPKNREQALVLSASPDLFRTLGISLVAGRSFTDADTRASAPVAIVDEAMAKRFWPNQEPVGKRIQWERPDSGSAPWRQVVGVVRNIHYYQLERQGRITAYRPTTQAAYGNGPPQYYLFVKTTTDPRALAVAIRRTITTIDAGTAAYYVQTMDEVVNQDLATVHLLEQLLGAFAGLALALAAIGIYGLMAYTVATRTREMGIRMALGATAEQVAGLVMRRSLTITWLGIGSGLVGAALATQALRASLFGVSALDPMTYALGSGCLAGVAVLASWIPARRTIRIPPAIALRSE